MNEILKKAVSLWKEIIDWNKEDLNPMRPIDSLPTASPFYSSINILGVKHSKDTNIVGIASWDNIDKDSRLKRAIKIDGKTYGFIYESYQQITKKGFEVKVGSHIIAIDNYRSFQLCDEVKIGPPNSILQISLLLNDSKGEKIIEPQPLYLRVSYNDKGKLIKLEAPGTPIYFNIPQWPVITKYHNKIYLLPINSGVYEEMIQKIDKNNGVIEIGDYNTTNSADYGNY